MSSNIVIPLALAHRAREIHDRIDALGMRDELESDDNDVRDEGLIVGPDAGGILVAGKSFDPTLPFGGRLRGKKGQGVRVGDACDTTVNDVQGCAPPIIDPCTYRGGQRLCDMQKVAKSIVVAGGTVQTITIEPKQAPYFDPKAVRARVTALVDSSIRFDALVTAVAINKVPQEGVHETNPVAPVVAGDTVEGWWASDWEQPDSRAIPVPWGYFTREALGYPLQITVFALGTNVNVLLLVTFDIYGNLMAKAPNGRNPGVPYAGPSGIPATP